MGAPEPIWRGSSSVPGSPSPTGDTRPERKLKLSKDAYEYWRARCSCGWPGSPWESREDAVREFDAHECWPV